MRAAARPPRPTPLLAAPRRPRLLKLTFLNPSAAAKEAGAEELLAAALRRFAYDAGVRRSAELALRALDAAAGGGAGEPRPLTLADALEDMELNRQLLVVVLDQMQSSAQKALRSVSADLGEVDAAALLQRLEAVSADFFPMSAGVAAAGAEAAAAKEGAAAKEEEEAAAPEPGKSADGGGAAAQAPAAAAQQAPPPAEGGSAPDADRAPEAPPPPAAAGEDAKTPPPPAGEGGAEETPGAGAA